MIVITFLAKMEIYLEKHFTLDDTLNEIAKVSQEDILDIANELFKRDRIYTTILKPQPQNSKSRRALNASGSTERNKNK